MDLLQLKVTIKFNPTFSRKTWAMSTLHDAALENDAHEMNLNLIHLS